MNETKDLIQVPFRDGLTLGIEIQENTREVSSRPTHYYVHRADGTYLGFACFGCCGKEGKLRAEVVPDDEEMPVVKYFGDLDSAVRWLEKEMW